MKIVYVHGRGQQGKKKTLTAEWDSIFRKGLKAARLDWPTGATSVAPFYGDVLAKRTMQADNDIFGLVRKGRNAIQDRKKRKFYREFLGEIAAAQGIRQDNLVDDEGTVKKGFLNWRPVNSLLRKLNKIERIAKLSIEKFTRDVYYYLESPGIRGYVDEIVEAEIPKEEPCVVVSHSLGTIVAYNVFSRREDLENIRTWVTLGSPLGIQAVYERLPSGGGKRIAPYGIRSWYNGRDAKDVVAINPIPETEFAGSPIVENYSKIRNQTDNRHGIAGYLDKADVARRICAAAE